MSNQFFLRPVRTVAKPATPVSAESEDAPTSSVQSANQPRRVGADRAREGDVVAPFSASADDLGQEAPQPDQSGAVLTSFPMANRGQDQWGALRFVSAGVRRHFLSGVPLVNYFRRDPAAQAIDLLRTRLLQTLRANGWNRIAIASPTQGCGTTFTAVYLAQSLARIPRSRNVLMDINNRAPGIAGMLDIDDAGDMRGYLAGEVPMARHLVRMSGTLALGLTAEADQNAAEILLDARCGATLDRMNAALRPDVILYDLPPILAYDDLAAFLPQIDGVLLVADGTQTKASQIKECKRILEGKTQMLGVILNRTRILRAAGEEA